MIKKESYHINKCIKFNKCENKERCVFFLNIPEGFVLYLYEGYSDKYMVSAIFYKIERIFFLR